MDICSWVAGLEQAWRRCSFYQLGAYTGGDLASLLMNHLATKPALGR